VVVVLLFVYVARLLRRFVVSLKVMMKVIACRLLLMLQTLMNVIEEFNRKKKSRNLFIAVGLI